MNHPITQSTQLNRPSCETHPTLVFTASCTCWCWCLMSVVLEIGDALGNIIKRPNNIGLHWWQQEVANLHFHGNLQIPSGVSLVLRQILIQFWSFPKKTKISEPYVDSPSLPLYSSLTHPCVNIHLSSMAAHSHSARPFEVFCTHITPHEKPLVGGTNDQQQNIFHNFFGLWTKMWEYGGPGVGSIWV